MILFGQRPETGVKKPVCGHLGAFKACEGLFSCLCRSGSEFFMLRLVTTVNKHQQPPVMICGQTF
jgi:hypothetical protein